LDLPKDLSLEWHSKIRAVFTALLCCYKLANGQQLNFKYYNQSNGLINNEVHRITQASNGFMYFGTPSGISILDGASFTNYGVSKGFRHNIISGIQEMGNEKILLFANSNQYYEIIDQRLQMDSFPEKNSIKNIYHSKSGPWWACCYSGLYAFNNRKLNLIPISAGKSFPGINCVAAWQDSLLVVGRSYEPLDIYNTHNWHKIASSPENLFVRDINTDRQGNIWIASIGSGVLLLKPTGVREGHIQFEKLPSSFTPFKQNEFRSIVEDKEGNLWMASINNGLIRYNPVTREFMHINMENGLASNTIFSLYCDKEDNIWIGTNQGVQELAHNYTLTFSSKQGLPADLVLDALPLPGNQVITGGYSGVGFIGGTGNKIRTWHPPLQDEYFFKFDQLGNEYFGLSLKKLVAIHVSHENVSAGKVYPLSEHFRCMVPFQGDKLLLGGDESILIFSNHKFNVLTNDGVHLISCMTVNSSGELYTGSLNNSIAEYRLNTNDHSVSASLLLKYSAVALGNQDFIQCITTDKRKDRILYGSSQNGIIMLVHKDGQLIPSGLINVGSGLSNNNVVSLNWLNDSSLLAGTGYGLDKIIFSASTDSFYVHNLNDYYNFSNTVYSIIKNESGHILLGTEAGLLEIPTVNIEKSLNKILPVVISAIQLPGNPDSTINTKRPVELPYNNTGITVTYSSPTFVMQNNTRFTYLLEGGNQHNWSKPSTSNHVTFLNLSPGKYRFKVKPVNIYGEISNSMATIAIIINPAFWQKWWFGLTIVILLGLLLYFIIRKRIKNIRHESALKNKIAETEMTALRAQMNPHFIFNCMNIIDGLITSDRKQEAQDFLQMFSQLIRLVLENSQYQQVPLQQDLEALKLYTELEAIRSNHHFKYKFDVEEELLEDNYKIPPLLLQPYIENAIIHGLRNKENGDGRLLVQIKKDHDEIVATVEDNGIGRERSMRLNEENKKPHQSLGMKVTAKRIDLLRLVNQKISIHISDLKSGNDTGTLVKIILPQDLRFE
jgi:hypothetical protein